MRRRDKMPARNKKNFRPTEKLKRQGLKGGGICKKGMNRQAVGKNS